MSGRPERRRGSLGTRAPVIGLIGPIGCGKSTVAGWLAERGVAIIDSDQLTRRLMTPESPVTDEIFARFGAQFRLPNGELDRRALARHVPPEAFDGPRVEREREANRRAARCASWRRPATVC